MKKSDYYTSGQFAKMAHISVRTVRYYDKMNILKPSYVKENGNRYYSSEDFVRLQQILLLKYLGFSLEEIKAMTVEDMESGKFRESLDLQLQLVKDRIEQMELVAKAIEDTIAAHEKDRNVDWSQMMKLIHLTNMENSLQKQYLNASNISARIRLHRLYSTNPQGWFSWIYEQCSIQSGEQILEIGCGNGALWKENFQRLPSDIHVVLNDISEGMIRDVRREFEGKQETFEFATFDCARIPYQEGQFDLVIANHVLFYCDDIGKVLSEVSRVLKHGGRFICSTYGCDHMVEITHLVQEFNDQIVLSEEGLYNRFGLENGNRLLEPCFNDVEKRLYEDSLVVDKPEPLIEYILSCHGNQNQYILDRYKDFWSFVSKKIKRGFQITKAAGIFVCKKE